VIDPSDGGSKQITTGAAEKPRWIRDLLRFLPLKSQFVLSGNVRDHQISDTGGGVTPQPHLPHLAMELRAVGYTQVESYDPASGFRVLGGPGEAPDEGSDLLAALGLTPADGVAAAGIDLFAQTLERAAAWPQAPIAIVADFASRMIVRNDALTSTEHHAFTRADRLAPRASPAVRHSAEALLQLRHLDRRQGGRPPGLDTDR